MKHLLLLLAFAALSSSFSGCTSLPVRLEQPWLRQLHSLNIPVPPAKLSISVSGHTSPSLGNESLLASNLKETLGQLIARRGYDIYSPSPDYSIRLLYRTDRADKLNTSSSVSTTTSTRAVNASGSGAAVTSGLGVSIARAITALSSTSSTFAGQTTEQTISYTHTITVELSKRDSTVIWKGESTWDSHELDLTKGITYPLQLILSDLPTDAKFVTRVREVKESHALNYYRVECDPPIWFTCPSLPYRIYFEHKIDPNEVTKSLPYSINNPNALAAYVDLIQTAEYALPSGNSQDWVDPLDITLWKHVTLGRRYHLDPGAKPINVIITLDASNDGYYVNQCSTVSNEEFAAFSSRLEQWHQTLESFYDVYK